MRWWCVSESRALLVDMPRWRYTGSFYSLASVPSLALPPPRAGARPDPLQHPSLPPRTCTGIPVPAGCSPMAPPASPRGHPAGTLAPAVFARILSFALLCLFAYAAIADTSSASTATHRAPVYLNSTGGGGGGRKSPRAFEEPWFCHGSPCAPFAADAAHSGSGFEARAYEPGTGEAGGGGDGLCRVQCASMECTWRREGRERGGGRGGRFMHARRLLRRQGAAFFSTPPPPLPPFFSPRLSLSFLLMQPPTSPST